MFFSFLRRAVYWLVLLCVSATRNCGASKSLVADGALLMTRPLLADVLVSGA